MLKYPVVPFVAILLIAISAACTAGLAAPTPEEAAQLNSTRLSPETAATFQVVGTRRWEGGVVVLYTYLREQAPIFGYALTRQLPFGAWEVTIAGAGDADPPVPENLIDYRDGGGSGAFGLGGFTIVFGRTLAAEVARVQVTFANGQVVQDEGADGAFALIAPATTFGCDLRVFGAKGELLRHIAMPGRLAPGTKCPKATE
jgi:hypothetical protein